MPGRTGHFVCIHFHLLFVTARLIQHFIQYFADFIVFVIVTKCRHIYLIKYVRHFVNFEENKICYIVKRA